MTAAINPNSVDYRTDPSQYRHWKLQCDGSTATLSIDIDEDAGIRPGYKLKLNSYDLGVDIELHDALNQTAGEVVFEQAFPAAQIFAPSNDDVVGIEPMAAPTNALRKGTYSVAAPGRPAVSTFTIRV